MHQRTCLIMTTRSAIREIINNCLAMRVRIVARSVSAIYEQAMANHDVTIAQVNMLTALGELGPCAPGKIGEVLQLERSTVSRNLDLLIQKGLVEASAVDTGRSADTVPQGRLHRGTGLQGAKHVNGGNGFAG